MLPSSALIFLVLKYCAHGVSRSLARLSFSLKAMTKPISLSSTLSQMAFGYWKIKAQIWQTQKESRPDVSLPGFSLPPLSCLYLKSPKASLPCLPRTDTWVCRQPCCLSASSSWHPSMDEQPPAPRLPPSNPSNFPASASHRQLSSALLPCKTILWESHCMTFWPKNKAISLGTVLTRRLFYCGGSDITAMLFSVLLTSHDCHLTLTATWERRSTYYIQTIKALRRLQKIY